MVMTPTDLSDSINTISLVDWGQFLLSIAAFVVSIIALLQSSKAQKLQNRINEMELRIKQNEIEKIEQEKAQATRACVETRIVSLGQYKHEIKVWNSGNAPAYDVIVRFDEEANVYMHDKGIQPFEELLPMKNYTIPLFIPDGCARKVRIVIEWTETNGKHQRKVQTEAI